MRISQTFIAASLSAAAWAAANPVKFLEPAQISIPIAEWLALATDLNGDGYTDFVVYGTGLDIWC